MSGRLEGELNIQFKLSEYCSECLIDFILDEIEGLDDAQEIKEVIHQVKGAVKDERMSKFIEEHPTLKDIRANRLRKPK